MIEKDKDAIKYHSMGNSLLEIFLFKTLRNFNLGAWNYSTWWIKNVNASYAQLGKWFRHYAFTTWFMQGKHH